MFRDDFQLESGVDWLALDAVLMNVYIFGTAVPQSNSASGYDQTARSAALDWLKSMLAIVETFQDCPDSQLSWEALCNALFKGYHSVGHGSFFLYRMKRNVWERGMVPSSLESHAGLLERQSRRDRPTQLHARDGDSFEELYERCRDHPELQGFEANLLDTTSRCQGGSLFRTHERSVGIAMHPVKPNDVLARSSTAHLSQRYFDQPANPTSLYPLRPFKDFSTAPGQSREMKRGYSESS